AHGSISFVPGFRQSSRSTPAQPSPSTKPIPSTTSGCLTWYVYASSNVAQVFGSVDDARLPVFASMGTLVHFPLPCLSSRRSERQQTQRRSAFIAAGMPSGLGRSAFGRSGLDSMAALLIRLRFALDFATLMV